MTAKTFDAAQDRGEARAAADAHAHERLPRRIARAPLPGAADAYAAPRDTAAIFAGAVNVGIHRAAAGDAARGAAGRAVAEADTGSGASVPSHLAEKFGAAGQDVSGVRLHTGASSARAAESVSARAYATGQDVHFGAGQFAPGTAGGDHLIAHEVAHTIQQRGAVGAPQFQLEVSQPHDASEREADQIADAIVGGGALPAIASGGAGAIARWADDSTAMTVQRLIDSATPAHLAAIRTALGDARGSAEAMVPVDIPGYAGYVARQDVRGLFDRAQHRLDSLGPRAPDAHAAPPDAHAAPPDAHAAAPDAHAATAPDGHAPPWWLGALTGHGMRPAEAAADASTRLTQYVAPAQQLSQRVMADVVAGRIPPDLGAEAASDGRTALRVATRDRISPAGLGVSEMVEGTGPTLGEITDRYALRALERDAELRSVFGITTLTRGEEATESAIAAMRNSESVQMAVIRGAGSTNRWVTGGARFMRVAGPVMMGAQLAVSGYRVLSAEEGDHMYTAGEELSGFAGGTLGGAAGGVIVATLGAVCVGAGVAVAAPVAIVIGLAIVGGMAMAGDSAGRSVWDRHVDRAAMREGEFDLERSIEAWRHATVGARIAAAAMPMSPLAAGGGFHGLMERDRREHGLDGHRGDSTSGGEAP